MFGMSPVLIDILTTMRLALDTWDAGARKWGRSEFPDPSCVQIEAAIRALDPAACPILEIFLDEAGAVESSLTIQGGEGKYTLRGTVGDGKYFEYFDVRHQDGGTVPVFSADEVWEECEC